MKTYIDELVSLLQDTDKEQGPKLYAVANEIAELVKAGATIWLAGCGGSAAQADHLAAELIGRLKKDRAPIPAVSLSGIAGAVPTCIGNDFGFDEIVVRQLEALGRIGDVLIVFTTSGKSGLVMAPAILSEAMQMYTVAFTGRDGMLCPCDATIAVNSDNTPYIQDVHSALCHILAQTIENNLTKAQYIA